MADCESIFFFLVCSHIIRLSDAFMLFQEYHGDCFSIHTWKRFLSSRVHSDAGVCFDEIRFWLCEVPSGEPIHDRELQDEKARLDYIQWQHSRSDYEAFRLLQVKMFLGCFIKIVILHFFCTSNCQMVF